MARGRFGLDAARPDMVQATPQKVKPDNHGVIMVEFLDCWPGISTVIQWMAQRGYSASKSEA